MESTICSNEAVIFSSSGKYPNGSRSNFVRHHKSVFVCVTINLGCLLASASSTGNVWVVRTNSFTFESASFAEDQVSTNVCEHPAILQIRDRLAHMACTWRRERIARTVLERC